MIYSFFDCQIDTVLLELNRNGIRVDIEPQVFSLLICLIENRHRVMSKDEILESVWCSRIVSDGTLNTRINAARKAVGDNGQSQKIIRTLPRRGFRFVADIDASSDKNPTYEPTTKQPSLIVLPFKNLSENSGHDYFADGLTEDLLTGLSRLSVLRVIARHTSFYYKGHDVTNGIEQSLGIDYLFQGSVRRAGKQVRISAQMIDSAAGEVVWAEQFDGFLDNIFDLQDQIASKIVASLSIHLTREDQTHLISRYSASTEARDFFMQARLRYRYPGPLANAEAHRLLDQALALDPDMGWAMAIRAYVKFHAWYFHWSHDKDIITSAMADVVKAVTLDPDLAPVHSYYGWLHMWQQKHDIALEAHRTALAIDSNYAEGYIWYASSLIYAGNPEAAFEPMRKALLLDPHFPAFYRINFANLFIHVGEYENAAKQLEVIQQKTPDFPMTYVFLAIVKSLKGDLESARQASSEILQRIPGTNLQELGQRLPYADKSHWNNVMSALKSAGLE